MGGDCAAKRLDLVIPFGFVSFTFFKEVDPVMLGMKQISPVTCVIMACAVICAPQLSAMELLSDPGFEDPNPIGSDPWRLVFFTPAPVVTDAMLMPNNGLEHASVQKDQSLPNADPQIASAVFAGFGPAAGIDDFRGLELDLSVEYKVVENTIVDSNGIPGTFVRMFLAFFGDSGFLGFGSFADADVFESGINADYVHHSFQDIVPSFNEPVRSVDFNLAVLGQVGATGTATVFFDDASLTIVPEPSAVGLCSLAFLGMIMLRRAKRPLL
jgi:hypothetical protein